MRRIQKLHLVGIGGTGMAGIAEVLHNLGYQVTGSDLQKNSATEHLSKLGIGITYSHIAENVANCDAIVVSTAVAKNNIEIITAKKRRIPVVARAEMLAELMRFKNGIAVAGTHGKTTTTSLIASLLAEAGLDPTYVIGGKLTSIGSNAKLGKGAYFVAEADESDASFLHLSPTLAVITNIEAEHLSAFDNDFEKLQKTFLEFIYKLPFYGLVVVCIDDPVIRKLILDIDRPFLTYGFSDNADFKIVDYSQNKNRSKFNIQLPTGEKLDIDLNLPGRHNALNATAAIAIALEVGVKEQDIISGLYKFEGVGRRFQILGDINISEDKKIMLIDDYGHHPKEIKAVLDSIKQGWPNRKVVMVYQPHRYTRTKDLFNDFINVLKEPEQLLLLKEYTAGEEYIPGYDYKSLAEKLDENVILVNNFEEIINNLSKILCDDDVLLLQGAGDIGKIAKKIFNKFKNIELELI